MAQEEEWPALFPSKHLKDETMDVSKLGKLWNNEIEDEYGKASILGTTAIALRAMGLASSPFEAEVKAENLWETRNRAYLKE